MKIIDKTSSNTPIRGTKHAPNNENNTVNKNKSINNPQKLKDGRLCVQRDICNSPFYK